MTEDIFFCKGCNKVFESLDSLKKAHFNLGERHEWYRYKVAELITIAETPTILIHFGENKQLYIYPDNLLIHLTILEEDNKVYKFYEIEQNDYQIGHFAKVEVKK